MARGLGRGAETPADPPPGSCTGHPAHSSHPVKVAPRPGLDRCFCPHRRLRAHRRKPGRRCPGHQAGPSLASLTAPPPGSPPAASLPRSPPSPAGGPLAAAARKRTPASPLPGRPLPASALHATRISGRRWPRRRERLSLGTCRAALPGRRVSPLGESWRHFRQPGSRASDPAAPAGEPASPARPPRPTRLAGRQRPRQHPARSDSTRPVSTTRRLPGRVTRSTVHDGSEPPVLHDCPSARRACGPRPHHIPTPHTCALPPAPASSASPGHTPE